MIENIIEKKDKIENKKDREIEKAIYLLGTKSAAYNGHAGLLLIDKEKKGIFYSTVFSVEKTPGVLKGQDAPFRLYKKELNQNQVQKFFTTAKIPNIDDDLVTNFYLSNYNKYIKIPIDSKEQGKAIYRRAEEIHKKPSLFNLYEYNCGHVTQDILHAGKTSFAPVKGDLKLVMKQFEDVNKSLKAWNLFMAIKKGINAYNKNYELGIIPKGSYAMGIKWAAEKGYEAGTIEVDGRMERRRKEWLMSLVEKNALASIEYSDKKPLEAVLVLNNKIIGSSYYQNPGRNDPTNTPEIIAIRNGLKYLEKENKEIDFSKLELYTIGEPSPISIGAIGLAGIEKVYIGLNREDMESFGLNNNRAFDVFLKSKKENSVHVNNSDDISNHLKNNYGYDKENGSSNDKAWIFRTRRDKRGKFYKKLVATGQDNFDKTNDVTSYAIVDVIRKALGSTIKEDLSQFEIVTEFKPGPVSLAAIDSVNLKEVVTGRKIEQKNKKVFPDLLSTIRGEYDKSLFKTKNINRESAMNIARKWKGKKTKKQVEQINIIKEIKQSKEKTKNIAMLNNIM